MVVVVARGLVCVDARGGGGMFIVRLLLYGVVRRLVCVAVGVLALLLWLWLWCLWLLLFFVVVVAVLPLSLPLPLSLCARGRCVWCWPWCVVLPPPCCCCAGPRAFCPGGSFVIDYTGMILREAAYPEEQVIGATIDIEALREHRARINHNCWVDVRTEGFRQIYEKPIYPGNRFPSGTPPRALSDKMAVCRDAIDDLYARGQFVPPHGQHAEEMSDKLDERIAYAQNTGRLLKPE